MKEKRQARKVTAFLLSLLLTIVITTMMIAGSFRLGICNPSIFVKNVFDNSFYESLYEELDNELKYLLWEQELPIHLADNVFVDSQIYIDGKTYINSVLNGKEPKINTTKIEETLTQNIKTYLEEKGQDIEKTSVKKKIETIVTKTASNYKNNISLTLADYFYQFSIQCEKVTNLIFLCGGILVLGIIAILLGIYHRKYRALRYVIYAIVTATISNTLYTMYATKRLTITNVSGNALYYQMVENYLKEASRQGYFISLVGVVFIITILLLIHMGNKKYKHK